MARTKDPKLEKRRREQVLDATISLLERGSWHGTTLAAVAKHAGVSKGMVTYYFPDKNSLILSAIDRFHERYAQRLGVVLMSPGSAAERLEALIQIGLPSVEEVTREVAFQVEVLSFAKSQPEAATRVRMAYATARQLTEAMLTVGVAEGYVHSPPEGLGAFVHALIDGLSLHVASNPEVDLPALRVGLKSQLERWFVAPA